MSSLDAFERELVNQIGRPTQLRPFVCDGSPLDARVFLVGFNPASEMSADFWDFWVPGYGFDKSRWFAEYKRDRATRPLKPGKKSRPAVSPSRRIIEQIVTGLGRHSCLETNVFTFPSPNEASLEQVHRDVALFRWLVETIRPELLIVHGASAAAEIERMSISAETRLVPHFSRGWSYAKASALGLETGQWLASKATQSDSG
ncbi:hypothetical protein E8L99_03010 [Phreatobacter aquaticus]|uniref:Uracil-DNA glycosylase-like domain-containing protein n=1 Tax=Phreatobacter aquaticus TaxID=2570229 RepID=A0A4D7QH89_9HYPH|nr:hypothetical protein [Phreatobacter aquaticus]QCK84824.1 hypothetical protein E8L99_03010 [Phreatobacter aquaticus]